MVFRILCIFKDISSWTIFFISIMNFLKLCQIMDDYLVLNFSLFACLWILLLVMIMQVILQDAFENVYNSIIVSVSSFMHYIITSTD